MESPERTSSMSTVVVLKEKIIKESIISEKAEEILEIDFGLLQYFLLSSLAKNITSNCKSSYNFSIVSSS